MAVIKRSIQTKSDTTIQKKKTYQQRKSTYQSKTDVKSVVEANKEKLVTNRQQVVDYIVEQVQNNNAHLWESPVLNNYNKHFNPTTGTVYRGTNRIILSIAAHKNGWSDPRWITFNEMSENGWSVEKGSKMTMIEYWTKKPYSIELKDKNGNPVLDNDGNPKTKEYERWVFKPWYVFNAQQVQGIPPLEQEIRDYQMNPERRVAELETIMAHSEAPISFDQIGRNYYSPSEDAIHLTKREGFKSDDQLYAAVLHEIAHSTGHNTRLNREGIQVGKFGDAVYAQEELVAEFTSAMMNDKYNLPFSDVFQKDNSAAYIASWHSVVKDNPNALFSAAAQADKVMTYIETKMLNPYIDEYIVDLQQEEQLIEASITDTVVSEATVQRWSNAQLSKLQESVSEDEEVLAKNPQIVDALITDIQSTPVETLVHAMEEVKQVPDSTINRLKSTTVAEQQKLAQLEPSELGLQFDVSKPLRPQVQEQVDAMLLARYGQSPVTRNVSDKTSVLLQRNEGLFSWDSVVNCNATNLDGQSRLVRNQSYQRIDANAQRLVEVLQKSSNVERAIDTLVPSQLEGKLDLDVTRQKLLIALDHRNFPTPNNHIEIVKSLGFTEQDPLFKERVEEFYRKKEALENDHSRLQRNDVERARRIHTEIDREKRSNIEEPITTNRVDEAKSVTFDDNFAIAINWKEGLSQEQTIVLGGGCPFVTSSAAENTADLHKIHEQYGGHFYTTSEGAKEPVLYRGDEAIQLINDLHKEDLTESVAWASKGIAGLYSKVNVTMYVTDTKGQVHEVNNRYDIGAADDELMSNAPTLVVMDELRDRFLDANNSAAAEAMDAICSELGTRFVKEQLPLPSMEGNTEEYARMMTNLYPQAKRNMPLRVPHLKDIAEQRTHRIETLLETRWMIEQPEITNRKAKNTQEFEFFEPKYEDPIIIERRASSVKADPIVQGEPTAEETIERMSKASPEVKAIASKYQFTKEETKLLNDVDWRYGPQDTTNFMDRISKCKDKTHALNTLFKHAEVQSAIAMNNTIKQISAEELVRAVNTAGKPVDMSEVQHKAIDADIKAYQENPRKETQQALKESIQLASQSNRKLIFDPQKKVHWAIHNYIDVKQKVAAMRQELKQQYKQKQTTR